MFRIAGPHYISIYENNGCIISLFGDIHFSKSGSCNDCIDKEECMDIIQFFNNMKTPIDIFLESHYYDKKNPEYKNNLKEYYKQVRQGEGFLRETVNYYKLRMYRKKHKPNSKVHVHYGDIRSHSSLYYFYWIKKFLAGHTLQDLDEDDIELGYALIQSIKTKHYFKKIVDAMVKSNDFKKDIEKVFGEIAWIYTDDDNLTMLNGHSHKIHRIRKQILKLTPKSQKAILQYHNDATSDVLSDYYCYHYAECRKKILKKNNLGNEFNESALIISTCIDKWLSHLMEIYTLSRMLYSIEKKNKKNITLYAGANHVYVLNYFFANYMKDSINHLWEYNSEKEETKEKRCVLIPDIIIKKVIKGVS